MPRISTALLLAFLAGCLPARAAVLPDVNELPTRKEMPDPLVMNDGSKATNAAQWQARRAEIKRVLEYCTFDQHWLIALVAPRPFITLEGIDDQCCNGNALKESYLAAEPVYDLLGASNRLGVNFCPGPHQFSAADWQAALDFADHQLLGKPVKPPVQPIPTPRPVALTFAYTTF
ncbi:MAG: hypothetical protein ABSA47_02770 [Verrucomicrobiota bacterium]|jgi:hypothetical protein